MKTVKNYVFIFLCVLILFCADSEDVKRYRQLRKDVLTHYETENNPLKEKAARFLLDNLFERYAIEGDRYNRYSDTIKRYYLNADTLHKKLISVKNRYFSENIVKDIDVLTPAYLIDNIDRAFAAWDKAGWKDQVSFDDFCEYILPYRIGNEPLENWRKGISHDTIYKITGDTINSFKDIKTTTTWFTIKHSGIKKYFRSKWGEMQLTSRIYHIPFKTFLQPELALTLLKLACWLVGPWRFQSLTILPLIGQTLDQGMIGLHLSLSPVQYRLGFLL